MDYLDRKLTTREFSKAITEMASEKAAGSEKIILVYPQIKNS